MSGREENVNGSREGEEETERRQREGYQRKSNFYLHRGESGRMHSINLQVNIDLEKMFDSGKIK